MECSLCVLKLEKHTTSVCNISTQRRNSVIKKTTSTREEFGLHRGLAGHAIYLLKDIYHENYNL